MSDGEAFQGNCCVISEAGKVVVASFSMSSALPVCPSFDSESVVKNGSIHNGRQNHLCKNCGRQFVEDSQNKVISDETKALIDKLLLEKYRLD